MTGLEVAAPYIAAAVGINSIYGAVTGTPGGLIGEVFGQEAPKAAAPAAPAPAQLATQATPDTSATTALPSVTQPPVTTTLLSLAPPVVTPPPTMPSQATTLAAAQRQSILDQRKRQGRASTILTNQTSDLLG
ncbi:hypothetical protein UFOVP1670_14 [uncultured Caudovirales phage]|uniref:Uncharacterized protein n=1 Tax=uncultured Caudovirales phage TaxID=2100421 RepID=A0A6J5T882_9CAUD|nr:hypothetical protein UFOVP1670_14 [uncultured Caudovirales phage]